MIRYYDNDYDDNGIVSNDNDFNDDKETKT